MPNFPIIDAHVHMWDPDNVGMTWIDNSPVLSKKYLPAEFKELTTGIEVEGFVYLETGVEPHWAIPAECASKASPVSHAARSANGIAHFSAATPR